MIDDATCENKEILLTGDLNCDYLDPKNHRDIKGILERNCLKQLIKQPTRITEHSKTLIVIFCSNNTRTISNIFIEPSSASDHDIIGSS